MDEQKKNGGGNRNRHRPRNRQPQSNYVPPYAADILERPLSQVGLADRTLEVLNAGRLNTVGDVVRRRKQEMYKVQNFGKKQLADLCRALEALKVDFRPDEAEGAQQSQREQAKPQQQGKPQQGNAQQRDGKPQREQGKQREDNGARNQPAAKGNRPERQQNAGGANPNAGGGKGKGKHNRQPDDGLTLDKLFPKPKMERLPRIEMETDAFVKFQRGGKWGFKNKAGEEVIPPIYDEVFNFKEDYACVERKQLFGYIDRQNELVIPYRYVCASSFSEGYACVADEEKCGYINKAGEVVVPFKYEAGTAVTNGLAHVKLDGKWGTLTIATNEISWA